jgi:putative NADPH-quinone reductase
MNITIIYSHPWEGSYNHAILERVKETLSLKHNVDVIDLNRDNFDPVLREKELALYSEGKFLDPRVKEYQEKLEKTDHLLFIHPIWWADVPAILKGFFDKVLLKYWAYEDNDGGLPKGLLTHIKGATVITTMMGPNFYYDYIVGNPLKGSLVKGTIKFCGIKKVKVIKVGSVTNISDEKRKRWLDKIGNYMKKI